MKLKIFTLAAAALAIVSCAKMETPAVQMVESDQEITFEAPIAAPATKADYPRLVLYGTTYPENWRFNVQALWYANTGDFTSWATGTNVLSYIPLSEASYDGTGSTFRTENKYYWPKYGYLAFCAYSPSSETKVAIGPNGVTFGSYDDNYTVTNDGDQVDLMYSEILKDRTKAYAETASSAPTEPTGAGVNTYNGVQIPFKHALSCIVFQAKTAEDYGSDVEINITDIHLENIYNKGYFGYADGAFKWQGQNTLVNTDNVIKLLTPVYKETVIYNGGDFVNLMEKAQFDDLLIMPQSIYTNAKIVMNYTINQNNEGAIPQVFEVKLNELVIAGGTDTISAFEMGKKYIFNFTFKLDEIIFSPEVTDWTAVTIKDIYPIEAE